MGRFCWYYLRFCDPANESRFVGEEAERYWMGGKQAGGVDLYVGGRSTPCCTFYMRAFGTRCSLISPRFETGAVPASGEPGNNPGRRQPQNVEALGNVIDPLDVIAEYGADAFRCYEMFMGPLEQMKPWSMKGVEGLSRFLAASGVC